MGQPNNNSHDKPIIENTPTNYSATQPKFDKLAFDKAIYNQGYNVFLEKAIKCPCRIKANDNGLTDCSNCGGGGWLFVNKRSTVMVTQSMNRMTKFKNWSEEDRGTISITARDDDKLAFMDRITNLDLESSYNEVVKFRLHNDKLMGSFIYTPNQFEFAHLFLKSEDCLKPLSQGTDFTVDGNIVTLNDDLKSEQTLDAEFSVSFRYYHHPQYHVVDIPRERVANRGAKDVNDFCDDVVQTDTKGNESNIPQLPINAVGRKAHYIMDKPDLNGVGLNDNSVAPAAAEELTNCDLVNQKLSDSDKLECILPTLNFKLQPTFDALSNDQKIDICAKVGATKVLAVPFPTINLVEQVITILDSVGVYTVESFSGNVTAASYKLDKNDLNGFQPIILPITLALGYKLEITATRATPDVEDAVVLKGT